MPHENQVVLSLENVRWGFDGGNPAYEISHAGTYTRNHAVDPAPCYAHSAELVGRELAHLQQVAPLNETGRREHPFSGPLMSRWLVPIDDTNTMFIELRHLSETEENPPWWVDRKQMMPGQIAMDTYEDSQRHPGDYEAQVGQGPMTVHSEEHFGQSDRGVLMVRRMLSDQLEAMAAGRDPIGVSFDPDSGPVKFEAGNFIRDI